MSATDAPLETRYVALLERNGARIRRICRSWAGAVDASDLESEVFLQLWRALPSFEGRSKEDTWVYRVTLNVAMAASRKERLRRAAAPTDSLDSEDNHFEPSIEARGPQDAEARETRLALQAAMATLTDADRSLLALWLEELPYCEIAAITGITENHVGVRVHRIKKKLAQELGSGGSS